MVTLEFPLESETETTFSVRTKLTAFEMGLTFVHLHSTYCLLVPLSTSLPSTSSAFALELSPIRFQRYFYKQPRCRRCHSRRDCSDLYDSSRDVRSNDPSRICKVIGKHAVDCSRFMTLVYYAFRRRNICI